MLGILRMVRRAFSVIMSSVCADPEVEGGPAAILLAKLLACCGKGAGPLCIGEKPPGLPLCLQPSQLFFGCRGCRCTRFYQCFAVSRKIEVQPCWLIAEEQEHEQRGQARVGASRSCDNTSCCCSACCAC